MGKVEKKKPKGSVWEIQQLIKTICFPKTNPVERSVHAHIQELKDFNRVPVFQEFTMEQKFGIRIFLTMKIRLLK